MSSELVSHQSHVLLCTLSQNTSNPTQHEHVYTHKDKTATVESDYIIYRLWLSSHDEIHIFMISLNSISQITSFCVLFSFFLILHRFSMGNANKVISGVLHIGMG